MQTIVGRNSVTREGNRNSELGNDRPRGKKIRWVIEKGGRGVLKGGEKEGERASVMSFLRGKNFIIPLGETREKEGAAKRERILKGQKPGKESRPIGPFN